MISYHRHGRFQNGEYNHSMQAYRDEYILSSEIIQEVYLLNHKARSSRLKKGKPTRRLSVSEEIVNHLRKKLQQNP